MLRVSLGIGTLLTFGAAQTIAETITSDNSSLHPTAAVPELSSMVLLGSGLLFLARLARRGRL